MLMPENFEPTIIGFTCNWCSYRAADLAGTARMKYAPNVRLIRMMCSGRLDPTFVLRALASGADGVMITGCHPGECHYMEQNYKALRRYLLLKRVLQGLGIEPERVKLVWASAAEGARFASETTLFVEEVRKLGPLHWEKVGRNLQSLDRGEYRPLSGGCGNGEKPKFAMYWAAACGGCEIAVLNTHEKILDVEENFDIVFWPITMDAKYKDLEAMEDGSILLTFFSGGIRNDENEHIAKLLRQKSKILIAFGSCAGEGCIPGLANLSPVGELVDTAFNTLTTENPDHVYPRTPYEAAEGPLYLPSLLRTIRPLDQVVDVDYYIPGCPPESHQIAAVIDLVIKAIHGEAKLPPKGAVIGTGHSTVCDECPRTRNVKAIKAFKRIQDVAPLDPTLCILEQGVPCNGPATRSGCNARCPQVGAQCIGCYGPAEGVMDYGARLITAFASVIDANTPDEINKILDGIPDPVGQVYRFNLSGSLMRAAKSAWIKK